MTHGMLRPILRPILRPVLRSAFGGTGVSGYHIRIAAPDGAYPGAPLTATGGTPIAGTIAGTAIIIDGVSPVITPYRFVINGVETGNWFESPTTIPNTVVDGDTIQVRDAAGRLSNTLIAGQVVPDGFIAVRQPDGSFVTRETGGLIFTPL